MCVNMKSLFRPLTLHDTVKVECVNHPLLALLDQTEPIHPNIYSQQMSGHMHKNVPRYVDTNQYTAKNTNTESGGYLVSSKKATFMVWMSTSVCALAKMVTSPLLVTFRVLHTTTSYETQTVIDSNKGSN